MRQMAHAPNGTRAKWYRRQMAHTPFKIVYLVCNTLFERQSFLLILHCPSSNDLHPYFGICYRPKMDLQFFQSDFQLLLLHTIHIKHHSSFFILKRSLFLHEKLDYLVTGYFFCIARCLWPVLAVWKSPLKGILSYFWWLTFLLHTFSTLQFYNGNKDSRRGGDLGGKNYCQVFDLKYCTHSIEKNIWNEITATQYIVFVSCVVFFKGKDSGHANHK
jgi:hypothetical protein